MKNTKILDCIYIVFSLNFLTVNALTTERHFTVGAGKLYQHVYFKGTLTLKFESNLEKRFCFGLCHAAHGPKGLVFLRQTLYN